MSREHTHWIVLAVALFIAVAAWLAWLYVGASWAHGQAQAITEAQTRPSPSDSSILSKAWAHEPSDRERYFTERGQLGDSFGGLNAFLTAIAGALVFWAGYMQHQLLKKTRETAQDEKTHRELQQFESLFFQLLQLSAQVTERIEGPKRPATVSAIVSGNGNQHEQVPSPTGPRALNAYAQVVFRNFNPPPDENPPQQMTGLAALVESFLTRVYDRQPSAFGPYYRILYQTFKHVADSHLSEAEQIRYANIARGQISEGAVLLLALNGLTYDGYKFIPLIEKFGLLEHLHRSYWLTCERHLLLGYRPRAFMGSVERLLPQNDWQDTPLLPADHFLYLERNRGEADQEAAFQSGYSGGECTAP